MDRSNLDYRSCAHFEINGHEIWNRLQITELKLIGIKCNFRNLEHRASSGSPRARGLDLRRERAGHVSQNVDFRRDRAWLSSSILVPGRHGSKGMYDHPTLQITHAFGYTGYVIKWDNLNSVRTLIVLLTLVNVGLNWADFQIVLVQSCRKRGILCISRLFNVL